MQTDVLKGQQVRRVVHTVLALFRLADIFEGIATRSVNAARTWEALLK